MWLIGPRSGSCSGLPPPVRPQCQGTVSGHNVRAQCQGTSSGHNMDHALTGLHLSGHTVRAQRKSCSDQNPLVRPQLSMLRAMHWALTKSSGCRSACSGPCMALSSDQDFRAACSCFCETSDLRAGDEKTTVWHSTASETAFEHRDCALEVTCSSCHRGAGALAITKMPNF